MSTSQQNHRLLKFSLLKFAGIVVMLKSQLQHTVSNLELHLWQVLGGEIGWVLMLIIESGVSFYLAIAFSQGCLIFTFKTPRHFSSCCTECLLPCSGRAGTHHNRCRQKSPYFMTWNTFVWNMIWKTFVWNTKGNTLI